MNWCVVFANNDVPLDVLVIDMEWHNTFGPELVPPDKDQSGHTKGWTGYSWNHLLFPVSRAVSDATCTKRG